MKRLTILLATAFYCLSATAQTDTIVPVQKDTTLKPRHGDTLRVGNIIIIKKGSKNTSQDTTVTGKAYKRKSSRVTTNWGIVDIGFSNYSDKTNYGLANADGYLVNRPGTPLMSKDDFKVRTGKSININIWFFMQQLNIVKQNVSLKYGLGLELNNYRYKSSISYKEDGPVPYLGGVTNKPFIFRDSIGFSKNKLAADYLTVPVMLNFATNPLGGKGKRLNIAFGASGGYLYSQRNKQRSDSRGKEKNRGDYDLEKFKLSYIGEIGLGPVKLYASYSPTSIYEHSMDMRPYNFGIRLGQ